MRDKKITLVTAGILLCSVVTAVIVLLVTLGGYWLVAISAIVGGFAGARLHKEEQKGFEMPADWYQDVGTKH